MARWRPFGRSITFHQTPEHWVSCNAVSIAGVGRLAPRKGKGWSLQNGHLAATGWTLEKVGGWEAWLDRSIAFHHALRSRGCAIVGWNVDGGFGTHTGCAPRLTSFSPERQGTEGDGRTRRTIDDWMGQPLAISLAGIEETAAAERSV
jgi:hypothetical protein